MAEISVYITAKPGDKIEVRERKTDTPVYKTHRSWEELLTREEWHKCRDGLTIYKKVERHG